MNDAPDVRIWQESNYSTVRPGLRICRGQRMPFEDRTNKPALTLRGSITAIIIERGVPVAASLPHPDKPPYRVPTMTEIATYPPSGFDAVSTFSGCGGSSLGYRMAGFRVLWASEFVQAARDTYQANAAAHTVLDARDIREVTGEDILAATGKARGELDLLDGSPPCAAFSTAGARERDWGKVKNYSDTEQRSDDLFFEYARLVEAVQPRVFVAENVSGLVKGTAKGYFKLILARLRAAGYRVEARLLDASWLGVPQARQRIIFVGVRDDLGAAPVFPRPLPYYYTVRDALPWITAQARGGTFGAGGMRASDEPSGTIGASVSTGNGLWPASVVEAQVIHDTSGLFGSGNITDRPSPSITVGVNSVNSHHFQVHAPLVLRDQGSAPRAASIDEPAPTLMARGIGGVHRDQAVLAVPAPVYDDAGRACDPETGQRIGMEGLSTVVAWDNEQRRRGISPPQLERRRFTLGELRAIGGFPPDFALTGSYGQRWERIGRAVPPVMMAAVAAAVRDGVLAPLRERGVI